MPRFRMVGRMRVHGHLPVIDRRELGGDLHPLEGFPRPVRATTRAAEQVGDFDFVLHGERAYFFPFAAFFVAFFFGGGFGLPVDFGSGLSVFETIF